LSQLAHETARPALDVLWDPVEIGPLTVPNRVVLGPLTTNWARDGLLSDRHLAFYEERARGGAGLIVSEQQIADRPRVSGFRWASTALDRRVVEVYSRLGDAVHEHGAKQIVQLWAPGPHDSLGLDIDHWTPSWAPSSIATAAFGELPKEMDAGEIKALVSSYALASRHVDEGGLDGVEVYAADSWLLHRFLSPLFNRRRDRYGGSVEGRCRIVFDITEAIRAAAPRLVVGLRVAVDEYMGQAGLTEDLVAEQLRHLVASGLYDYVSLSAGNELRDDMTIPPLELAEMPSAGFGRRARQIVGPGVKVIVTGGVRSLGDAAELVREGAADLVALARPYLADAELVRKARNGAVDEIIPCVGDNDCFRLAVASRPVACWINPATGRERRWGARMRVRADEARRVTVVGAGPAGLQAAIAAAERGHHVTVLERESQPGGHLATWARLPHRQRWQEAIDSFVRRALARGVDLWLDHAATEEDVGEAEVIICATGARWQKTGFTPARPDRERVPGTTQSNVLGIDEATSIAVEDPTGLGSHVVIVDETGDYLPLGLADIVSAAGGQATVVSRHAGVGGNVAGVFDLPVFGRLAARGVRLVGQHLLEEIDGERVTASEVWSGRLTAFDGAGSVVLSMLRESRLEVWAGISALPAESHLVGDALVPRHLRDVIAEGHGVGLSI
jgi:2,4-dienoyl-CoA reductase-like NADH-dependent reductase (Old Yellow Enzyme family)